MARDGVDTCVLGDSGWTFEVCYEPRGGPDIKYGSDNPVSIVMATRMIGLVLLGVAAAASGFDGFTFH